MNHAERPDTIHSQTDSKTDGRKAALNSIESESEASMMCPTYSAKPIDFVRNATPRLLSPRCREFARTVTRAPSAVCNPVSQYEAIFSHTASICAGDILTSMPMMPLHVARTLAAVLSENSVRLGIGLVSQNRRMLSGDDCCRLCARFGDLFKSRRRLEAEKLLLGISSISRCAGPSLGSGFGTATVLSSHY